MQNQVLLVVMVYMVLADENLLGHNTCKEPMCLTWKQTNDMISLTCKIQKLELKVDFIDPTGKEQAFCVTPAETPHCVPNYGADTIVQNLSTNETIFTFSRKGKGVVEGNWLCAHGRLKSEVAISLLNGTMASTEIIFNGEISHSNQSVLEMTVYCFSCWEPVGNSVEFSVNGESMANIRYSNGTCYYRRQQCTPDKCSCSSDANYFTWTYVEQRNQQNGSTYSGISISCEMRFEDQTKHTSYKKWATLLFNATAATLIGTDTIVITSPEFTNDNENKAETHERNHDEYGLAIRVGVTGISTALLLIGICCCLKCYKHFKKDHVLNSSTVNGSWKIGTGKTNLLVKGNGNDETSSDEWVLKNG